MPNSVCPLDVCFTVTLSHEVAFEISQKLLSPLLKERMYYAQENIYFFQAHSHCGLTRNGEANEIT